MILYHGTSTKYLDKILSKGLLPRKATKRKGQWDRNVQSKLDFVYLTSAYPVYFALNAAENDNADLAIIKVEIDEKELYPDEDFIARMLWEKNNRECDLSDFNSAIDLNEYKHLSQDCLNYNGIACTHSILSNQIISSKVISRKDWKLIMKIGGDSMPIPINYKIMGEYYERCIEALFKDGEKAALELSFEEMIMAA